VLAVVQDDQQPLAGQRGDETADRIGGGRRGGSHAAHQRPLAQAERRQQGLRHLGRIADRGQLGQPDPAGHALGEPVGGLDGQPRLAGPAGPGQGDEAVLLQELGDPVDLLLTPDEAREPDPQVGAGLSRTGRTGRTGLRPGRCASQYVQVRGLQRR
jgi:hypothetical protein